MAKNPRARSGKDLSRRKAKRPPYLRVLIVCEGAKTEVNYLQEIRQEARISSAHIRVIHSPQGQEPQQIVEGAIAEFNKSKEFECVYVVFDRDEHRTYVNAIAMAEAKDGKLKNDEKKPVIFQATVSVPNFELWLLLHFVDIQAYRHRDEVIDTLKQHIANYEKGKIGIFSTTADNLTTATNRASRLKQKFSRLPGNDAYTDVHELVAMLRALKNGTKNE
jgi:hypothetical protein